MNGIWLMPEKSSERKSGLKFKISILKAGFSEEVMRTMYWRWRKIRYKIMNITKHKSLIKVTQFSSEYNGLH